MKIQVMLGSRAYTYWIDADVSVGDVVLVPPPFWAPRDPPQQATVHQLGSDYDGPLMNARLPPGSGQGETMDDELRQSDLEDAFGGDGWVFWPGVNGRPYGRRVKTSPANTMHGEDWTDLRDNIRAWYAARGITPETLAAELAQRKAEQDEWDRAHARAAAADLVEQFRDPSLTGTERGPVHNKENPASDKE